VTLNYPGLLGRPIIVVSIQDLLTGNRFLFPMLLDTGADETCFPAKYAAFFGHNNQAPRVKKKRCCGVGGISVSYIHSVQLSLLDPMKSTKSKQIIAWTAKTRSASFVQKLDTGFGLLGMDIISRWKSVCFETGRKSLNIRIRL
jgi:hypothetical protein